MAPSVNVTDINLYLEMWNSGQMEYLHKWDKFAGPLISHVTRFHWISKFGLKIY